MGIGNNIKKLREVCNLTQIELATMIGVSDKTVSSWEINRTEPKIDMIEKISIALNCKKTDIIGTDTLDTEEINTETAENGNYFSLQIKGDSMEPRICNGDIVIVRQQDDAESGDIVIALVSDDDATCKRLRKYRDGIELISNNPSYQPVFYSNEEMISNPVKIIGKVVELRRKF